jgi:signal transduction histidine kinase
MRLHAFITANADQIIPEWESFARSCLPAAETMTELALRNHVRELLQFIAQDMVASQSVAQQAEKSKGRAAKRAVGIDSIAETHADRRALDGYSLSQVAAEFRALRASVMRLWSESLTTVGPLELAELTRFHESIDQLLAESIARFIERVEYSRDLFLGILGHDIRGPLNSISMSAQLLLISNVDSRQLQFINQIQNAARNINTIVNDLLEFARRRLGTGIPVTPAPMELDSLCREVLEEIKTIYPDRTFQFDADRCSGSWDRARMRQVISNLLTNAATNIFIAPLQVFLPGLFIFFALMSFNLLGDALRDALDPRLTQVRR